MMRDDQACGRLQGRLVSRSPVARCGRIFVIMLVGWLQLFQTTQPTSAQYPGQVLDQAYLNVPFDRQETIVWCWVASARMVARYYNVAVPSQCQMLQGQYGAPCCSQPALCARAGHISEIQALIQSFGLRFSQVAPRVDGPTLLNIFKQGHPVIMHVDNSHFVVAVGMKVVATQWGPLGIVRIHDPIRGTHEQDLPSLYQRWGFGLYVF
jgi:hypothetical protein